jgi:elongation factor Ts
VGITAQEVKALRDKTGAGMMDCKKALVESNGDTAKAEKMLKELGLSAADKRGGKATNEGRVFSCIKNNKGVLLELSSETDFVARNDMFIKLGEELSEMIVDKGLTDITDEMNDRLKDTQSLIKENMAIKRFEVIDISDNEIASEYIHGDGKIGVIVKLKLSDPGSKNNEKVKELAFDLALHVAAFAPSYLSIDKIDVSYKKEQEEIARKQVEKMDKPEKVIEGIIKGKLNKDFSKICLLEQGFVKEEKTKTKQILNNLGNELGIDIEISDYMYIKAGLEE